MASAKFELYKSYYDAGKWSKEMIRTAVEHQVLTEEEYMTITNEEYVPVIYVWDSGDLNQMVNQRRISGDPNATSNQQSSTTPTDDSGNDSGDTNSEEDTTGGGN